MPTLYSLELLRFNPWFAYYAFWANAFAPVAYATIG